MKKTVTVVIEKEIEVELPDSLLTPEYMDSFMKGFWPISGPDDLFKYAGGHIAQYDNSFIDGLGEVLYHSQEGNAIKFRELTCDVEVTVGAAA